jgi:HD-GYP domain-containing protein (c-di-GMP phosphodiesterase class II)
VPNLESENARRAGSHAGPSLAGLGQPRKLNDGLGAHTRDAALRRFASLLEGGKRPAGGPAPAVGDEEPAAERVVAVALDLAKAVDLRFSDSAHSETVGRNAGMMARELGFSEQRTARVLLAGMLHDVGKVGVPDGILRKPAKLTDEEFEIVRAHPQLGARILEHSSFADIRKWVGAHHERPDGRGYPLGLSGEKVPVEAQILAVADAYEAMTSDRSYRSSIGHKAARSELERGAGTQFEPRVVDALLTVLARDAVGTKRCR